jgi:hypothetical protein|uniref:Uncharacterized protein n=1 Tax=Picea glauca TaxID=3330 RepID=A0A101LZQ9_PICGL|nr:hypothetical protein ABT39_MTgene5364 [Picea glauca]QHR88959.1 hypothetical protein Q903MT_gene2978 [Picea sitchensis]
MTYCLDSIKEKPNFDQINVNSITRDDKAKSIFRFCFYCTNLVLFGLTYLCPVPRPLLLILTAVTHHYLLSESLFDYVIVCMPT